MKAIRCKTWGKPEDLVLEEIPSPTPKAGEVRIGIRACGVNFADTLIIGGRYQVKPPLPFSPGIGSGRRSTGSRSRRDPFSARRPSGRPGRLRRLC